MRSDYTLAILGRLSPIDVLFVISNRGPLDEVCRSSSIRWRSPSNATIVLLSAGNWLPIRADKPQARIFALRFSTRSGPSSSSRRLRPPAEHQLALKTVVRAAAERDVRDVRRSASREWDHVVIFEIPGFRAPAVRSDECASPSRRAPRRRASPGRECGGIRLRLLRAVVDGPAGPGRLRSPCLFELIHQQRPTLCSRIAAGSPFGICGASDPAHAGVSRARRAESDAQKVAIRASGATVGRRRRGLQL